MAAVDNSSSHSLSPKVPKFILIARESLVFQLLLSISAPSRSVTDYLGHSGVDKTRIGPDRTGPDRTGSRIGSQKKKHFKEKKSNLL